MMYSLSWQQGASKVCERENIVLVLNCWEIFLNLTFEIKLISLHFPYSSSSAWRLIRKSIDALVLLFVELFHVIQSCNPNITIKWAVGN